MTPRARGPGATARAAAAVCAAAVAACAAPEARAQSLDAERLGAWLAAYGAAWEAKDADAAARLFTDDARYYETPYSEPFVGRAGIAEYWADVTAAQNDIDFSARIVAIEGDTGVARWSVELGAGPDATPVALDGVFVLRFEEDLCAELREWWHMRP